MMQLHQKDSSVAADAAISASINPNSNPNLNPNLPIHLSQQIKSTTATVKQTVIETKSAEGTTNSSRQKPSSTEQQQHLPPQPSAQKCPRCDSTNTKFCYYNNYSLSQPRHFCKNCRRYWTKGGALRNVPVGGGCRKNKRVKQRSPLEAAAAAALVGENEIPAPGTASALLASCMNGGLGAGHLGSLSHLPSMMDASGGLFPLPSFSGPFDPAFMSPFSKAAPPAPLSDQAISPLLFQHHPTSDFSQFFDTSSGIPTLDHLSGFSSPNPNSNPNPNHLLHHQQFSMESNGSSKEQQWQQQQHMHQQQNSSSAAMFLNMQDYHQQQQQQQHHVDGNGNSSSVTMWNASWPEMHAALANGSSTAAGASGNHYHNS